MAPIKKNFLYSSALTVSGYIFPFITYPYVSRVLGVNNIGICNFVDSIINYFILFSMLGISVLGVREIAKANGDFVRLSRTFSELLGLNAIFVVISLIVLCISIFLVPQLYVYKSLMFIGVLKLVFNFLQVEWFFQGIENFKYVTFRGLSIKILYVFLVFIFIRDSSDYPIYYLLTVLIIVLSALINIIYSRKFAKFSWRKFSFRHYIRPFCILGIYALLTSMYTTFNVAYLGFTSNEVEVGYYTTATKLYTILLALFTAFTSVMIPRMSSLVAENKMEEFKKLSQKSSNILFGFSIPLIIYASVYAPYIINLIAGMGYEGAILPMRIILPLVLVIGYEQILICHILMPLKKDKAVLMNSVLGASVGIIFNILLVSHWGSVGSSIVWLLSEIIVLSSAQYYVFKYLSLSFPYNVLIKNILYMLPLAILLILCSMGISSLLLLLFIGACITIAYSFVVQIYVIRNEFVIDIISKFKKKWKK